MSKQEKINAFDPNEPGNADNNIFGLPFTTEESEIVVLPLPWEVTVSYSSGTAEGPQSIFNASSQIDLFDPCVNDAWKIGIAMDEIPKEWKNLSDELRPKAELLIERLTEGMHWSENKEMDDIRQEINGHCAAFNDYVKATTLNWLNKGKLVAGLGGDHSTPLGIVKALAEKHDSFAVLQFDAHADLRDAYEGFEFSHASIMFNVLKVPQVSKLVQVGIRDYCQAEADLIKQSPGRIKTFFDRDLKHASFKGRSIQDIQKDIINELPQKIYISFDIDALDPKLCPHTGTPVAGGFEFEEVLFLMEQIVESGKTIIGLDLNEVAPGAYEWDANVGGRLLYRMCNLMAKSNNRS